MQRIILDIPQRMESASHSTISARVYQGDETSVILAQAYQGDETSVILARVYQGDKTVILAQEPQEVILSTTSTVAFEYHILPTFKFFMIDRMLRQILSAPLSHEPFSSPLLSKEIALRKSHFWKPLCASFTAFSNSAS